MKFKTTKKEMMTACKCYSVSYCGAQNLLRFCEPTAYTCGVYGWNADIYVFGNTALVTGYRPFGKSVDYEMLNEFDKAAEKIIYNNPGTTYDEKKEIVDHMIKDFIGGIER